jgi:hypothetical protein
MQIAQMLATLLILTFDRRIYGEDPFWGLVPQGSHRATGMLEPMRCMSYFPVIIKTKHLKLMREFISTYHKRPFDEVFMNFSDHAYSQFNIMVRLRLKCFGCESMNIWLYIGSVHICSICTKTNMYGTCMRRHRVGMVRTRHQ